MFSVQGGHAPPPVWSICVGISVFSQSVPDFNFHSLAEVVDQFLAQVWFSPGTCFEQYSGVPRGGRSEGPRGGAQGLPSTSPAGAPAGQLHVLVRAEFRES